MPGYAPQRVGAPGSKAPSTHLATYWWGLEEKVAKVILAKSIGQALGCLERCHGACKADERKRLETRHRDCEVQAFRRGAAALCACSAGIEAHGLNPTAVAVMREAGIDISDHRSEVVTDAMIQWADTVITVCGNAREACPVLPARVAETHWPIPDPAAIKGDNAVVLAGFRSVREDIRARVEQFELGTETRAPDASC